MRSPLHEKALLLDEISPGMQLTLVHLHLEPLMWEDFTVDRIMGEGRKARVIGTTSKGKYISRDAAKVGLIPTQHGDFDKWNIVVTREVGDLLRENPPPRVPWPPTD